MVRGTVMEGSYWKTQLGSSQKTGYFKDFIVLNSAEKEEGACVEINITHIRWLSITFNPY